jgi:hypothetical protein
MIYDFSISYSGSTKSSQGILWKIPSRFKSSSHCFGYSHYINYHCSIVVLSFGHSRICDADLDISKSILQLMRAINSVSFAFQLFA